MKIRIKKLHPDAVIPKYQSKGASGFDLHALEDLVFAPGDTKLVKTGLAFSVGPGYEMQVRPRSGYSLNTPMRVANAPGTVDEDYRGEVCIIITMSAGSSYSQFKISKGDRIAQGVICPVVQADMEVVEYLDETQRGSGSFGSTGG